MSYPEDEREFGEGLFPDEEGWSSDIEGEYLPGGDDFDDEATDIFWGADGSGAEFEMPEAMGSRVYFNLAMAQHDLTSEVVADAISRRNLPGDYTVPEMSQFFDDLETLAPIYELFEEREWEPEIVFVPPKLTASQWNFLLAGWQTATNEISAGLHVDDDLSGDAVDSTDLSWRVILTSGPETTPLIEVSADGVHGEDADLVVDALAELLGVEALPDVVHKACPTLAEYLALQWSRLMKGEQPVDIEGSTTIIQSRLAVDGIAHVLVAGWGRDEADASVVQVRADTTEEASSSSGVRPTLRTT
jgi:hypothetical protein